MVTSFFGFKKIVFACMGVGSLATCLITLTACTPADSPKTTASQPSSAVTNTTTLHNATANLPTIYATTSIWAAVANAIGGDKVTVITAIDSPNQDPHNYQASAKDKLAMQNASIILVNGGGYDDWAVAMLDALPQKPSVLNAFELSKNPTAKTETKNTPSNATVKDEAEKNEHVFYSLDSVQQVANLLTEQLSAKDPTNQAIYQQNAKAFSDSLVCLKNKAHLVGNVTATNAIATESVSDYLLAAMDIANITPPAYIAQSETEAGVSAKVLQATKNAFSANTNPKPPILVTNAQTEDATAKQLIAAAQSVNAPTVAVLETLPAGETSYIAFLNTTINNFHTAINGVNSPPLAQCQ